MTELQEFRAPIWAEQSLFACKNGANRTSQAFTTTSSVWIRSASLKRVVELDPSSTRRLNEPLAAIQQRRIGWRSARRLGGPRRCARRSRKDGGRLIALLANRIFRWRQHCRLAHQRDAWWSSLRQTQELAERAIVIVARPFAVRLSRLGMPMAVIVFVLLAASVSMRVNRLTDVPSPRAFGVVVTVTYRQRHSPNEPDGPETDQAAAKHRAVHASDSTDITNGTDSRSITCPSRGCDTPFFRETRS